MILNYFPLFFKYYYFCILVLLIKIPFNLNNLYTNIQDFYSRLLLNDFFINSFYYMWTSFWYIPLLLFILLFFNYLTRQIKDNLYIYFYFTLILYFCYDINSYWVFNLSFIDVFYYNENFNNLLSNSVNKFHPGIFYYASLQAFSVIYLLNPLVLYNHLYFQVSFFTFKKNFHLFFIIITLFLGSWWALQEGSWGGWWNWDPSEVFGLLFLFLFALIYHKNFLKKFLWYNIWIIFTLFILITSIYIFIQLNFDLVSHNFGTKTDTFIDISHFYLSMELFCIMSVLMMSIKFKSFFLTNLILYNFKLNYNYNNSNNLYYFILSITLLICLELCFSFIPLVNDFLWKFYNVNITNQNINWVYYNLLLVCFTSITFWEVQKCNILLLVLFQFNLLKNSFLLLFMLVRSTKFWFLHLILLFSLILSIINSLFNFSDWGLSILPLTVLNQNIFFYENIKLNNNFIDVISFYMGGWKLDSLYNFILNDTTNEIYSFFYQNKMNNQQQSLTLGTLFLRYTVNTYEYCTQSILNLFSIFLYLGLTFFQQKKKIIF